MLNISPNKSIRAAVCKAALAALLLAGSGAASAAAVDVTLCAKAGTSAVPAVPVWGYAMGTGAVGDCTNALALDKPGGPVIAVNAGDVVTVTLVNQLAETTGLTFQGQGIVPDTAGTSNGSPKSYTFTAANAGTYLYQAAPLPNAEHQVAMGLYGALVVRSAGNTAYGVAYDDEAIVVLSEIDTGLNSSANPAAFDMRDFGSNALGRAGGVPMYYLINGKSYPDTLPISSSANRKLLIRYVNAGAKHHSMGLLGLRQRFIAKDGNPLPTSDVAVTAETLAPGQTGDALVTIPAVTTASQFALYDASLNLQKSHATANFGGMLTFVTAGSGTPLSGPVTSGVAISPNPTRGLTGATLTATVTGTGTVSAEYFIDSQGTSGNGIPLSGGSATIAAGTLAGLSSGNHTFYVHGHDDNGWGGYGFAVLNLDKTGPRTSALTLTPNPVAAGASVTLHASASDAASGGQNVTGAEYSLNGTTWTAMTLEGVAAPDRGLSATFTATASATVLVRSKDFLDNVGANASVALTVSGSGPATTINLISPNPANGVQGFNSSTAAVRVIATMVSPNVTVANAEAFIANCTPATCTAGSGIPLVASDGSFNGGTESGYVDIPQTTIKGLANGAHTISVHGRDSAGNWGAFGTGTLNVNGSAPTVTNVQLILPYTGGTPVQVNVSATDVGTGNNNITAGRFFIDGGAVANTLTVPGGTSPTKVLTGTITSGMISALSAGVHTVTAQAQNSGGNWSAVLGTTLIVDRTAPYLVSFAADGPLTTNANSVSYTVTFSEAVATANGNGQSSVGPQDFQVVRNGSTNQTNNINVSVTGTGATRTVTVSNFNNGTNSIQLRLRSPGTGNNNATITDLAGNNWANSNSVNLNGATYTIDRTGPAFSMSLTPTSVPAGTPVTLNISGATDPAGVSGGVWWIDGNNNNPPANATPFSISGATASVSIGTSALAGGNHQVRVQLTDTLGNGTSHSANLGITLPGPTVAAAFGGTVSRNGNQNARTTTYTITFTNPNAVAITGVGLTHTLPQLGGGNTVTLFMPSNPTSPSCGFNVNRQSNDRRFVVSNGTIPANNSCTLNVTVRLTQNAGNAGGYTLPDTIAVGAVTSSNAGSNTAAASATLTVNP